MAFSFARQLAFILSGTVFIAIVGWWSYSAYQLDRVLTNQIALRAQVQSQQLAQLPSLVTAVSMDDSDAVTSIVTALQSVSDADFITVSNEQGLRLAHPRAERIGFPVAGGDIERALQSGEAYLSYAVGSLGPSVRYITPIFSPNGEVVGMIKVGYLLDTLNMWTKERILPLLGFAALVLLLFILLSWRFSAYVKSQMQHLEPWQLRQALKTYQGVLAATHEGIIALNGDGEIYLANQSASLILGRGDLVGVQTQNDFAMARSFSLQGDDFLDKLANIAGRDVIINRVTVYNQTKQATGAVFSLRPHHELQALSDKLNQVDRYLESMRITRHEYQNKLSVVSGLLQMGAFEQALQTCLAQSQASQSHLDSLQGLRRWPLLSALILAKLSRAQEIGVHLSINCSHQDWMADRSLSEDKLCSLVGNLIDNALEVVSGQPDGWVTVTMAQSMFEESLLVSNNGPKVEVSIEQLCALGYTSKTLRADHGIGLHLVSHLVENAGGHIELDSDDQETVFALYFPKEKGC